ncbi:UNVERIFIED_CONTAM: hypothetical protein K2H54_032365 [Gekko kuhli]
MEECVVQAMNPAPGGQAAASILQSHQGLHWPQHLGPPWDIAEPHNPPYPQFSEVLIPPPSKDMESTCFDTSAKSPQCLRSMALHEGLSIKWAVGVRPAGDLRKGHTFGVSGPDILFLQVCDQMVSSGGVVSGRNKTHTEMTLTTVFLEREVACIQVFLHNMKQHMCSLQATITGLPCGGRPIYLEDLREYLYWVSGAMGGVSDVLGAPLGTECHREQ